MKIPKDTRDQLGKLDLSKWKGRCAETFKKLGYSSVDEFINDVRGGPIGNKKQIRRASLKS